MTKRAKPDLTGFPSLAFSLLFLVMLSFPSFPFRAADTDGDGLDDAWEAAQGYSTSLYTRIVYVDAVHGLRCAESRGGDARPPRQVRLQGRRIPPARRAAPPLAHGHHPCQGQRRGRQSLLDH